MLPVGILFCIVTAKAQVKVLADVAVDSAAHNEAPAVVAGVFHVDHFMIIFMTLRLGTTWYRKYTVGLNFAVEVSVDADNRCPCLATTVFLDMQFGFSLRLFFSSPCFKFFLVFPPLFQHLHSVATV